MYILYGQLRKLGRSSSSSDVKPVVQSVPTITASLPVPVMPTKIEAPAIFSGMNRF